MDCDFILRISSSLFTGVFIQGTAIISYVMIKSHTHFVFGFFCIFFLNRNATL